jgi:serine protease inhibitor
MADTAELDHLSFALALHRAAAPATGNSCFSPYSAASALGLVARGAAGETAAELGELLGNLDSHARLLRQAAELGDAGGEQNAPVLAVSNTLWAWDELPIRSEFVTELSAWPRGTVAGAPFVQDPEGARRAINDDVRATTRELIPELLQPGTVTADTVASLVNALYLRVAWSYPFREADTREDVFHAPGGDVHVPTMRLDERLGYARAPGWQVVALPAVGGAQAVVLLPDGDLAEQEGELDGSRLAELVGECQDRMVGLSLPKLRLDVRSELAPALRSLGVRRIFTRSADFSGITDDPRLLVSDVVHEAVLRIDESGLEGAAATAAMMRLVSMPTGDPVTVRVDRPFLLLVRHAATGAVYFLARVVDP